MTDRAMTVEGAAQLTAGLARFATALGHLDAAELAAGRAVQQRASRGAPVLTGALARSVLVPTTGDGVTVGSNLPYAGVQEMGWAAHNISAQPFLRPALADGTPEVQAAYQAEVQANLNRVKGA